MMFIQTLKESCQYPIRVMHENDVTNDHRTLGYGLQTITTTTSHIADLCIHASQCRRGLSGPFFYLIR